MLNPASRTRKYYVAVKTLPAAMKEEAVLDDDANYLIF